MLTFFRRIRKGLLGTGATSKYLLYAIGEIALVVIGILIALSINNWNEERKDIIQEQEILLALKLATIGNRAELEVNYQRVNEYIGSTDSILAALDREEDLSDELHELFYHALLTGFRVEQRMNMSGYKALESTGIQILRSEQLRLAIIDLYEAHLPWLGNLGAEWSSYLKDISIILIQDGVISYQVGGAYQLREEYNREDLSFLRSVIALRRSQKSRGLRGLQQGIEKCNLVLELIEAELKG